MRYIEITQEEQEDSFPWEQEEISNNDNDSWPGTILVIFAIFMFGVLMTGVVAVFTNVSLSLLFSSSHSFSSPVGISETSTSSIVGPDAPLFGTDRYREHDIQKGSSGPYIDTYIRSLSTKNTDKEFPACIIVRGKVMHEYSTDDRTTEVEKLGASLSRYKIQANQTSHKTFHLPDDIRHSTADYVQMSVPWVRYGKDKCKWE